MSGGGGSFVDQFLEDYFAESDEHLASARRVLLGLEVTAGRTLPDPALLRALFRSLHTLKGLAGMVGDEVAEHVAHAVEEGLRRVEDAATPLSPKLVDALFEALELLERCIAARRTGHASPDPRGVLERLAQALPTGGSPDALDHPSTTDEGARAGKAADHNAPFAAPDASDARSAETIYHFEFVPSPALSARGVGVDLMRERLTRLGTLLDARPRVANGGVAFDFWVAVAPERSPDPAWRDDGLDWTAVDAAGRRAPRTTRVDAGRAEPSAAPVEGPRSVAVEAPDDEATAEPGAHQAAESAVPAAPSTVVRVDLARLDGVMRLVGDLVVSRSRLDDVVRLAGTRGVAGVLDALEETNAAMERQLRQLRENVMRIRLVPIGETFERLRFAVRDAIRESGKRVRLAFEGQSTEIDKLVVDRMLEPMLHLVRNAVSHGIEPPDVRTAAGKPGEGTITLRATSSGDRISIVVEDDGSGIDIETVARKAREQGRLGRDEPLPPERVLEVLCSPGFSTREAADLTSGRGVGMDVVRAAVRSLAGELSLETTPGRGTRFVIELPLTLMILDALLVEIGGRQMAVPQPALREILQLDTGTIVSFENNQVIQYRRGTLPLVSLSRLFDLPEPHLATRYVLVVGSESAPMGLIVDRLAGLREIVVLPIADPLVAVPGIGGATELGDGRVTLILDVAALLRLAAARHERRPNGTGFTDGRVDATPHEIHSSTLE